MTEKQHYNIIILVIASKLQIYDFFRDIWAKYDKTHSNIRVFYVYGVENKGESQNENELEIIDNVNLVFKNVKESLIPGCLEKTIKALEYIDTNFTYNFLIRSNLSSLWRFKELHDYVENKSNNNTNNNNSLNVYEGVMGTYKKVIKFVSGAGILMSQDVVKNILKNKERINYKLIDDVALANLVSNLNIPINGVQNRYDFVTAHSSNTKANEIKKLNHFHFRVKTPDRKYDKVIMNRLYNIFYT